ncbi:MAG: putative ABC transporter permease [Eggerthellaceae bacterium]|nr:putative ABC transporter permease [Eggerthellaceae bacterium]
MSDFENSKKLHEDIELNSCCWYKRKLSVPAASDSSVSDSSAQDIDRKKLPLAVKIFGALCIAATLFGLIGLGESIWSAVEMLRHGTAPQIGLSSIVVVFVRLFDLALLAVAYMIIGVRLLRNQRRYAAIMLYAVYVLLILGALCSLMLYGMDLRLVLYDVLLVLMICFQVYLDPGLRQERIDWFKKRENTLRKEQSEGTLGRDPSGKGFLELNFFNLFWIFVVCSILGDVMESIFHVIVVDPGHWQDRAGLLFGPFSPIYGCGALLMTLFLNRLYKRNIVLVFLLSAIIGGAFEYFVSVFMQYTFGAVAWDYTGQWLSIGGRTCGIAMCAWGALGVVWLKLLLPLLLKLIDLIPWNWRYTLTTIAAVFMVIDCVMSLQALDCWYERLANDPVNSPIQHFYAEHFDNSWMENRFQSMTIHPDSAVRNS